MKRGDRVKYSKDAFDHHVGRGRVDRRGTIKTLGTYAGVVWDGNKWAESLSRDFVEVCNDDDSGVQ